MKWFALIVLLSACVLADKDSLVVSNPRGFNSNREFYIADVSTSLDSGDTVYFVDQAGRASYVTFLNCSTDASVKLLANPKGTDSEAVTPFFVGGGWHAQKAHAIYPATTDSVKLFVKTVDR